MWWPIESRPCKTNVASTSPTCVGEGGRGFGVSFSEMVRYGHDWCRVTEAWLRHFKGRRARGLMIIVG